MTGAAYSAGGVERAESVGIGAKADGVNERVGVSCYVGIVLYLSLFDGA